MNVRNNPLVIAATPRAHETRIERKEEKVRDAIGGQITAATLLPNLQQQPRRGIELAATRKQKGQVPEQHERMPQRNGRCGEQMESASGARQAERVAVAGITDGVFGLVPTTQLQVQSNGAVKPDVKKHAP